MEHEPIVVTCAGCVSALGHSVAAFWSALQDGRCGLGKLDESAPSDLKVSVVGAIPAPDPRHMLDARRVPMLDRFSVLAIVAAQQALAQSGLSLELGGHRTGCVVGVGTAGGEAIEELYRNLKGDSLWHIFRASGEASSAIRTAVRSWNISSHPS